MELQGIDTDRKCGKNFFDDNILKNSEWYLFTLIVNNRQENLTTTSFSIRKSTGKKVMNEDILEVTKPATPFKKSELKYSSQNNIWFEDWKLDVKK